MLLHYPQRHDFIPALPDHYKPIDDRSYLQNQSSAASSFSHHTRHQSMPQTSPHSTYPTVQLHRSTPSPAAQQSSSNSQPMLAQSAFVESGWGSEYQRNQYLGTPAQKTQQYHKRAGSGSSSVASGGPSSPLPLEHTFPHIANTDSSNFSPSGYDFDFMSAPQHNVPKSLPTPTDTTTMAAFYQQLQQAGQISNGYPSSNAMRRGPSDHGDDGASFAFSGPQSVSSMSHDSPATPHTNVDFEFDDGTKPVSHGYPHTNAYTQSLQDVFPDQMYPPTSGAGFQAQHAMQRYNAQHLSPQRASMFNRIQAANQDHLRTGSPSSSLPRQRSPFKDAALMQQMNQQSQQTQSGMINAPAMKHRMTESKSVSPKDLMLNEFESPDDADATPLFNDNGQSEFFHPRRHSSNVSGFTSGAQTYNQRLSFTPTSSVQIPQQYPFIQRQEPSMQSDRTPDFPAHLTSMESTVEEGLSEPSSSQQSTTPIQRPEDTSSDSGTYSCTYHGCPSRFESPARLQKHKREAHRQTSPTSAPTNTAAAVALRNSQAGPHKCERMNPSTGKPCNSIFSRPYDLTRHEDTIHNGRKQKVRCHLCTEEKTFSRNDALTRHMRVVHPDVDWPGKTRRKNGRD